MCKPFPPPLVRGGVFLVRSDTKYRDIADGNYSVGILAVAGAVVRYQVPRYSGYKSIAEREIPSCKAIFSHDD